MLQKFQYIKAGTVDDALTVLSDHAVEAHILAGGTDLLIRIQDGVAAPGYVVDVKSIPELRTLRINPDGSLTIGACVTANQLLEFESLPQGMEALREAASLLGTHQVRNRATVGGNICNASPACDMAPPLLVLGADVTAASSKGQRTIALKDFFECPEVTCLDKHEIVTEIKVPSSRGTVSRFAKRTRIRGHDLAVVNVAAAYGRGGGLRIALGAVAPRPLLIDAFDGIGLSQRKQIIEIVLGAIAPIDDVRGSSIYRRHMVEFMVGDLLDRLEAKCDS